MSLFTKIAVLGLAAVAIANDCDNNVCSSGTQVITRTSTGVNGVVVTELSTTTNIARSTTLVPVLTPSVDTSTIVGVSTSKNTLTQTTDVGTTPTNTQYGTTTDINLQSGYAYTTLSNGMTSYIYTGSGTPSVTPAAFSKSSSSSHSSTGNFAAATAVPMIGAVLAGGIAFVL